MVTTPFGYGCGNYKSDKTGCNFNIGEIAGVQLSEEQVKELLEKYGANKLSAINPDDYAAILKEAEVIGNA